MNKRIISLFMIYCLTLSNGFTQNRTSLNGTVTDAVTSTPLAGVSIRPKGSSHGITSDSRGWFYLNAVTLPTTIIVSHIGFHSQEITVHEADTISIALLPSPQELEEVMVSTGYETLPRERITGSFEQIDEALFNRRIGATVLDRLDGITAAIQFDRRSENYNTTSNAANISLRGPSTLFADGKPLIILDNFPYEGDPSLINPNEVASVTLLKDAAAASIWGARAGNGVIVITTKQPRLDQPTRIQFNTMVSMGEKLDFYRAKPMSSTDYIDVEQFLFEKGYYNSQLNSAAKTAVSPVVDLLWQAREGLADVADVQRTIESWRQHDVIEDFQRYIYRNPLNQQYALTVSGGGNRHGYTVMGGFDKKLEPLRSNAMQRINLRADNRFQLSDNLEIQSGIRFSLHNAEQALPSASVAYNSLSYGSRTVYPYAQFADDQGQPQSFPREYRESYTRTAGDGLLLDWLYWPLDERSLNGLHKTQDIRLNVSASYRILPELQVEAHYMHHFTKGNDENHYPAESYYARDLVNLYTQVADAEITRIIPEGGILQQSGNREQGYAIRGQANYQRAWSNKHRISVLTGAEVRERRTHYAQQLPIYGYNPSNLSYNPVMDFVTRFPIFDGITGNRTIPGSIFLSDKLTRFVSLFANASYTFMDRYVVSASTRRDASNIFGVRQNEKWTPLWSTGASWTISEEPFYHLPALSYLKARLTYGYSGNIHPNVTALTVIDHYPIDYATGLPYAEATNPPNPNLRWEQVRTFNVGLDFESSGKRLSGSVEYYVKSTRDLFANTQIDPTLGFGTSAMKNSANTKGQGVDVSIRSRNLNGKFTWNTHVLIGYNKTIITRYLMDAPSTQSVVNTGAGINPIEGEIAYPIYSHRWAGLDSETGDPIGYFNGEPSKAYRDINRETPMEDLVFHGSARPIYSGGVRNDFTYGPLSLSVNITWAANYYFRRPSLSYQALYANGDGHAEFGNRWQSPGDERHTNVPSMIYPAITDRDNFYRNASVNVHKGDHIRIRDVRMDYQTGRFIFYAQADNLGILWATNDEGLDPQHRGGIRAARMYALGCKVQL